eukprot:1959459-Amphidinium_carterae.1
MGDKHFLLGLYKTTRATVDVQPPLLVDPNRSKREGKPKRTTDQPKHSLSPTTEWLSYSSGRGRDWMSQTHRSSTSCSALCGQPSQLNIPANGEPQGRCRSMAECKGPEFKERSVVAALSGTSCLTTRGLICQLLGVYRRVATKNASASPTNPSFFVRQPPRTKSELSNATA